VPLTVSSEVKPGRIELKAKVSWIECEAQCVPGDAAVAATATIGEQDKASAEADLIERWRQKLPVAGEKLDFKASWTSAGITNTRPLLLEWNKTSEDAGPVDFYPYERDGFEFQVVGMAKSAKPGKAEMLVNVVKTGESWPSEISGLAVQNRGEQASAWEVKAAISNSGPASTTTALSAGSQGLWQMLLYAFLGGLILNVMPCVLPVIALKILGFVAQAKDEPRQIRKLGLIYGAGVLFSFLLLAALVIGVQAAGHKAGWGMQFASPNFIIVLTVLVTLVALNLFGLFDVNLSGKVMGAAGQAASGHGAAGAFFNGILATVLATPCTAPFLSLALGFAFAQSASVILLMFLTAGLGLAFPYVALSFQPGWLKFLPKPGQWMERFKIAMGFPMLATALWLFSLLTTHYGERAWWAGIFLVIVALAAWVFGEFVQRGNRARTAGLAVSVGILVVGYVTVIEGKLKGSSTTIDWQPWSPEAVIAARQEGRPVVVDFTAKWCATCNATVKPAFEHDTVSVKIKKMNAAAFLADYTKFPERMTEELNRFGSAGVPLVVVYPKDQSQPPIVLPQPPLLGLPSQYRKVILEFLEQANASTQAKK
jgi:thiol:disulfide interchange protein